jgi:hypothetical protein
VFLITQIARFPRKLLGFDIAEDKEPDRIQEIVDNSAKAKTHHTDGYSGYRDVIYPGKHFYHYDKSETYTVEGINSDLRHYIPFLGRRSKCFIRSLKSAKIVLTIFTNAYCKFGEAKFNNPKYKNCYCLTDFL